MGFQGSMQNYASLQDNEHEQEESGVLFHVAEPSRAKWNHIVDLDSFFSRVYRYHQRHGFLCIFLQEALELGQYVFMVTFTIFLVHCIEYPILFRDVKPQHAANESDKVLFSDFVLSPRECSAHFHFWTYISILIAVLVWFYRFVRSVLNLIHFHDTHLFFNTALGIADSDLDNLTWNEVQTRVRAVQLEQQMCIHKRELSELDIYHRILRQHNYLVAMTNKRLIPPRMEVPIVGEVVYWTKGLRCNMQLLLFSGPWALFENSWHLREEHKKFAARHELAHRLGRQVLWLALANLLLSPLVLLWQILYMFFNYAELVKREPGSLGLRSWSLYGRMYLRHFNELDHELQARLSRAHRPATKYLSSFSSPMAAIVARGVAFLSGAVLAVIISLTLYDEDVINVEHMLLVASVLTGVIAVCRALIPDEAAFYCPEALLANVLAHTHYLPQDWKSHAHTIRIRSEFQQLFQYRVVAMLEELLSPIITPYVLWQHIHPRALDIVDFYRNFTVSVVGVGDVCSFAQMDVRRHGNPEWHAASAAGRDEPNPCAQAEGGKIELSLVHFTLTNPKWVPPDAARQFVQSLEREKSAMLPPVPMAFTPSEDPLLDRAMFDSSVTSLPSLTHAWRNEGPLSADPMNMSLSTICLHERYKKQSGSRLQPGPSQSRVEASGAGESTPLLFIATSSQ